MNLNFNEYDFYDNHTHVLDMDVNHVSPEQFLRYYCHGPKWIKENGKVVPSQKAIGCLKNQGIIYTLVNYMSKYFDCEPTLERVIAARNEVTATRDGLEMYIKGLYDDARIVCSTLESEIPWGDPLEKCIPNRIVRLFRFEDLYFSLLRTEDSYTSLLIKLKEAVSKAKDTGFVGIKGHIAEKYGLDIFEVSEQEASLAFPAAKAGDFDSERKVYYAMFSEILHLCGDLKMAVHIHTGSTGMGKGCALYNRDPVLMAPFLMSGRYEDTNIVFLHGGYPFTRQIAMMAFNFSNIYVDLSQTLPWESLGIKSMFEDILALAPHNRIIMGSGQHGCPETAWAAAKVSKAALTMAMDEFVQQGLISMVQAENSARMILSENGLCLHGVI